MANVEKVTKRPFWERVARWAYPSIFELEAATRIERDKLAAETETRRTLYWRELNELSANQLDLKQEVDNLTTERDTLLANLTTANEQVTRLLTKAHPIPKWRELLEFAFELDGHQYHRFPNPSDLPLNRYELMQTLLMQLDARLSHDELGHLIGIGEKALEKAISQHNAGRKLEGLQQAMWAMQEMRTRNEGLMKFHPEILCDIAALFLIRDDEDPTVINEETHKQKKNLFLLRGGDADFFMKLGVHSLVQDADKFINSWSEHWSRHNAQIQLSRSIYQKIHSSVSSTVG